MPRITGPRTKFPRTIERLRSGVTVGYALLGMHGEKRGTVGQVVHDGDTVTVQGAGNFGARFLGVDAPEVSFELPGVKGFPSIGSEQWRTFLADPFAADLPPFDPPLSAALRNHLKRRMKPDGADNHYRHAGVAQRALEQAVKDDMAELGKDGETFRFHLAFAHEVMDGYGRLLCYLNRFQEEEPRPRSYNERLLEQGVVTPYFIWPNVNPFRRQQSKVDAVPAPGTAHELAEREAALRRAREAVRAARERGIGVFAEPEPLQLLPFELRFLARRRPPDRWVIDIGRPSDELIEPQRYYRVRNEEDRLFIPEEHVPLFAERGWRMPARAERRFRRAPRTLLPAG